jgi:hypothetical protein
MAFLGSGVAVGAFSVNLAAKSSAETVLRHRAALRAEGLELDF